VASRKTKVVDGFTAIRAAQEAARQGHGDPVRPDPETPKAQSQRDPGAGTRIGRSVMPTKREVICPACGVSTSVTGKVDLWVCTHCRHRMKLEDLTIPAGNWNNEVEIGGTVTIEPGAVLNGGILTANDIVLNGKMNGVELRACRKLVLGAEATPDWVRLKALDVELGPGVDLIPGKPIAGRHLNLHGKFSGNAVLEGTLTVHADGDFSGQLRAAGLVVEEGGGLRAQLDVNPEYAPPPPTPAKRISTAGKAPVKGKRPPGKPKSPGKPS